MSSELFLHCHLPSQAVLEYTGYPPRIYNLINQRQGQPSLCLGTDGFLLHIREGVSEGIYLSLLAIQLWNERAREGEKRFTVSSLASVAASFAWYSLVPCLLCSGALQNVCQSVVATVYWL